MTNFGRIEHAVLVGSCPHRRADVERLVHRPGITAIPNLQTDVDFQAYAVDWARLQAHGRPHGVPEHRWPMQEDDREHRPPSAVSTRKQLLSAGHQFYAHCTAGICRAPPVVMAFLAWHQGCDLDPAHQFDNRQRPRNSWPERIRAAGNAVLGPG